MKNLKVFEYKDMPTFVHSAIISGRYCNDVFIKWDVEDTKPERSNYETEEEYKDDVEWWIDNGGEEETIINEWLKLQGCEDGEKVILEHMW